jgi:hypothetical protein
VCECSNTACIETVELALTAYERIRSESTRFVIRADHAIPQIERVISRDDGYVVVEKLVAQEYMKETDPHSAGSNRS